MWIVGTLCHVSIVALRWTVANICMFLDALASFIILESPSEDNVGLPQNPSRLLLFQIGCRGQSLPIGKRLLRLKTLPTKSRRKYKKT